MAITDKEQGVWGLDQVYNKINQGGIWDYDGINAWFGVGKNTYGNLGENNRTARSSPVQLPGTTWSKISSTSGRGFFGLKTDGTAWAWGLNGHGQLGLNQSPWHPSVSSDRSSPTQIGTDTNWSSTFSNDDTNAFWIKTDGTLWSWGYGMYGSLGHNTPTSGWPGYNGLYSSPTQVGTNTTWSDVLVGSSCVHAVKTDGTLWAWGLNNQGSLGQNETTQRSSPVQIGTNTDWSAIALASSTKFGIKTDGSLWSWGGGAYGKNAQNDENINRSSPMQVGTDTTWDKFGHGYTHLLAVKTDNTLWSWGYNPFGNLGLNDRGPAGATSRSSPTQIPGTNWSQVASGYLTSAATKTDGTLWTWGENEGGQMGQDTSGSPTAGAISSPTQVGTNTGWSDPAAGREEFFINGTL